MKIPCGRGQGKSLLSDIVGMRKSKLVVVQRRQGNLLLHGDVRAVCRLALEQIVTEFFAAVAGGNDAVSAAQHLILGVERYGKLAQGADLGDVQRFFLRFCESDGHEKSPSALSDGAVF